MCTFAFYLVEYFLNRSISYVNCLCAFSNSLLYFKSIFWDFLFEYLFL